MLRERTKRRRRSARSLWAILIALCLLGPSTAAAQEVADQITSVLNRAQAALSNWFVRTLPLPSASAGVSYSFDPASGNFRRDPSTFGQIYLDRADPLGARRFNFSLAYQYTQLEELEGMDADDLHDPLPIPLTDYFAAVSIPSFRIDARVHQFLFAMTYGVSDDLDVGIAIPAVYSDLRVQADLQAAAFTPDDELVTIDEHLDDKDHPFGVGDVQLRAKYRVLERDGLHAAFGLLLRIPTGDEEDLQGSGFLEVAPSVFASTRLFEPAPWATFQGHLNAAVGFNADDVDSSDARWGVGVDWGITEGISLALAVLGRHPFARIGEPGAFQFTRCNTDLVTCAGDVSARNTKAPLFGLTGERADYYTASVGGRAALWRDTIFAFANVAFPLNDGFVRTAPIPLGGLEATF